MSTAGTAASSPPAGGRSEEYRAESQQMQVQFELNYVDESESPEYQGRFTVTNYYTVAFTADASGEVAIDD